MIVSYDEHEVNNTFKFGVIYQKFKQVRNRRVLLFSTSQQVAIGTDFHKQFKTISTSENGPCG